MKFSFIVTEAENFAVMLFSRLLKDKGHSVQLVFDPRLFNTDEISNGLLARLFDIRKQNLELIQHFNPDYVCFSTYTQDYRWNIEMAKLVKAKGYTTVFGGIHCVLCSEEVMKEDCVDIVCVGEGEKGILELADGNITSVKNFWFRGQPFPVMEALIDLDSLPIPDRDIFYEQRPVFKAGYTIATCYDDKTELLTKDGWKYFKELKYKDEIATLNKNGFLEYHKPSNIISEAYSGEMYQIKSRSLNLLITPNHNVYIKKPTNHLFQKQKDFELYKISEVAHLTQISFKRNMKWQGTDKNYFVLPSMIKGNGWRKNTIEKEKIIPMELWLEFLGYFLSEGCAVKKSNNRWIIKIDQYQKANPINYRKIKNCLKKLGYNFYSNEKYFEISNKQLYLYLKKFGKCDKKFIPKDILNLPSYKLKILLDALILGDGYKKNENFFVYITTSSQLRDDIQELALKIGLVTTIATRKNRESYIKGRKIESFLTCYDVYISNNNKTPLINHNGNKNIEKKNYKGMIYCCKVPNNIVYVRRNGKSCWSGNSRGCPYACSFCASSALNKHYLESGQGRYLRQRSPEHVIGELVWADERYRPKTVYFVDDNLTLNTKWLERFSKDYKKWVDIPFYCTANPATIKERDIELLKEAGCQMIGFGLQSASEKIRVEVLNRRGSNERIIKSATYCHNNTIQFSFDYITGLPSKSNNNVYEAFKFFNRTNPSIINTFTLVYLPHTSITSYLCKRLRDEVNKGTLRTSMLRRTNDCFVSVCSILPLLPRWLMKWLLDTKLYRFIRLPYWLRMIFKNLGRFKIGRYSDIFFPIQLLAVNVRENLKIKMRKVL